MKIKRLNASFGNLNGKELTLGDKLNIIEAPNESGKSTWCAFIRTMLYGIDTTDRDKIGHMSDKKKYVPWSGGQIEGTMELTSGGKAITLERTALSGMPMKSLTATYTETGELVPGLYADTAGEVLTGVPESVFERTAFIKQDGMRLTQTAELEKRIASLVSSGDENVSFTEADETLRKWMRRRKFNKSGSIPKMQHELFETDKKMARLEELNDQLAALRSEEEKCKKQKANYEADMVIHQKLDVRNEKLRILGAQSDLEKEKSHLLELKKKTVVNGKTITDDDIAEVKAEYRTLSIYTQAKEKAGAAIVEAEQKHDLLESQKNGSVFSDMTFDEVQVKAAGIELGEKNISETNAKRGKGYVLPIILMVLAVAAAVCSLGQFFEIPGIMPLGELFLPGLIGAGAVLLLGIILCICNSVKGKKYEKDVNTQLSAMGFKTASEMNASAAEYKQLCDETDAAARDIESAKEVCANAEKEEADKEKSIIELAKTLDPSVNILIDVPVAVENAENLLKSISESEAKIERLSGIYNTLTEKNGGEKVVLDSEHLPTPVRDKAGTEAVLKAVQNKLLDISHRISTLTGEINAIGDPAVISGQQKRLRDEITKQQEEYDAIELAVDVLREANSEMQAKFSPRLSADASEYMARMTTDRYEKLKFDNDFNASAKLSGDAVSRSVLSLSNGTSDQIYLSLRLAMCGLILTGDDPCPIILDDALVSFDSGRLGKALELLAELSENRQVIIFTCHSREAQYLEGREGVNVIRL